MIPIITLLLGLLAATVVLAGLATRLKLPYAIVLVLGGVVLGFLPGLPRIDMDPDIVLLLFLPPLVYAAAWQTSWRDFRANMRCILLLAIGLVLLTTFLVALAAHLLLNFSWPVAFVLGAILSPTDTVAANAIAQRMKLPRRVITILEGESLVNDATGLVAYTFAVAAAVTGSFQLQDATFQFFLVSLGGLLLGLVIAWPIALLHRFIDHSPTEITMTILTPMAAYLLAEWLHLSGVLAVVSAGLYLSRRSSTFFSAATRLQTYAVWDVLVFLLNGLLFLLIGLQLRHILDSAVDLPMVSLIKDTLLVSLTVMGARLLWVLAANAVPNFLFPRRGASVPPINLRNMLIVGWTGLRGGVSLAVALAVPLVIQGGQPFPERARIIAVTFGVILVTLVGQGLSLIPLVKLLGPPPEESAFQDLPLARLVATQAALDQMDVLGGQEWIPQELFERLRTRYEKLLENLNSRADTAEAFENDGVMNAGHQRLLRETIQAQRHAVIDLRNQGRINDEVFRDIENELDLEEQRLYHISHA